MGILSVRVKPRSGVRSVESVDGAVVVRVRSAPVDGAATDECRRVLADALGVPSTAVRLVSGAGSRHKRFEVEGLSETEISARLR